MNDDRYIAHRKARRKLLEADLDQIRLDALNARMSPQEMRARLTLLLDEYVPGWTTTSPELIDEWAGIVQTYDALRDTAEETRRLTKQSEDLSQAIDRFNDRS